jgi:hypothetical protein
MHLTHNIIEKSSTMREWVLLGVKFYFHLECCTELNHTSTLTEQLYSSMLIVQMQLYPRNFNYLDCS